MRLRALILLVLVGCAGLMRAAPTRQNMILINGVVAIVNEKIITYKDVYREMEAGLAVLQRRFRGDELARQVEKLQKDALNALVDRELILNEYKTGQYNPLPDSYIEDRINQDIRDNYGDRLTLRKTLQSRGMTYQMYRDQLRDDIVVREMWRHNVPQDPLISPARIEAYYKQHPNDFKVGDEVKLRMIVLPKRTEYPGCSPLKLAQEILEKIKQGAPFAQMAAIYSEGSQKSEGGDWGWVEQYHGAQLVLRKDLSGVAFSLKPGQVSSVIDAPDACYLMLVEDRRPAHVRPLTEVRDQIEALLKDQQKTRLRVQWISRLKKKSLVRFFQLDFLN